MNILLFLLFLIFFILAFIIFVDAVNDSASAELIPLISLVSFSIIFLTMFILLQTYKKYEVEVNYKNVIYYEDISEIITDGNRVTTEKVINNCEVEYWFDRELIIFDKSSVKQTYNDVKCSELSVEQKTEIKNKRLTYLRELNEH